MKSSDVDEMLGTPARLAILATVARAPDGRDGNRWSFMALRRETGLTDGNLHVQTGKLVEAGYLTRDQVDQGGRTATCFTLTEEGRGALRKLVARLREALEPMPRPEPGPRPKPAAPPEPAPKPVRRPEKIDDSRVW